MSSLLAEAQRQLAICNACRYCEGYCAVFPALERRRELDAGDVRHLANLCHDCRACLYACMYAPPHEFGVDLPELLTRARIETYDAYAGPRGGVPARPHHRGLGLAAVSVSALVAVLAMATRGAGALVAAHRAPASPYAVVPYPAVLAVGLLSLACGGALVMRGAWRYSRDTGSGLRGLLDLDALFRAAGYAATLRYLGGGGEGCYDAGEVPSRARRYLHLLLSYGFGLCLVSTVSAAVMQDLAGDPPPYPLLSLPVLAGLAGGAGLVAGCAGLIALKRGAGRLGEDPLGDGPLGAGPREDSALGATAGGAAAEMALRDYGLLVGLLALGATGLLTLATRTTAAYGIFLTVHLATVATCFLVLPYTKLVHAVYRLVAIVQDNVESSVRAPRSPRPRA